LDTYDFYNQKEESEEQAQARRAKYIWKVGVSDLLQKEFKLMAGENLDSLKQKIKSQRLDKQRLV